jgi:hypothetical protein
MKSIKVEQEKGNNLKVIPVSDLYPGMIFTNAVYIEGNNLLAAPHVPLKRSDIDRLNAWSVKFVETAGSVIDNNQKETFSSDYLNEYKPGENDFYHSMYVSAIKRLDAIFRNIEQGREVIQQRITSIVSDLMKCIRENRNRLLQYVLFGEPSARPLVVRAIHSLIISIVIGEQLNLLNHSLFKLGLASLLHDVGMLRIPESIVNKKEMLSDKELFKVRLHVFHSYNIISVLLGYGKEIGKYALFHHECWDGSGYPKKLAGDKIPLFSRIIACADVYTAMVNERSYKRRVSGYRSLKTIIGDNCKGFDPAVTQALLSAIGVYPIGSIVLLNNRDIGRVIDLNPQTVFRPRVKIIKKNSKRNYNREEIIDLLAASDIYITGTVEPGQC